MPPPVYLQALANFASRQSTESTPAASLTREVAKRGRTADYADSSSGIRAILSSFVISTLSSFPRTLHPCCAVVQRTKNQKRKICLDTFAPTLLKGRLARFQSLQFYEIKFPRI